jgi:hypothetical protein
VVAATLRGLLGQHTTEEKKKRAAIAITDLTSAFTFDLTPQM